MAQATTQTGYEKRLSEITKIWQDNRWLYVIAGVLLGILVTPALEQITGDLNDLIGNLVPEAVGIIFTVLILDTLAENRATEQLKKRLIREAGSSGQATASAAFYWLWTEFSDNPLQGADLQRANWEGMFIRGCDLSGANLARANLKNITNMDYLENDTQFAHFVILENAFLQEANLKGAYLFSIHLQGANMNDVNLQGADLTIGDLRNVSLSAADLRDATLIDTDLRGADFSGAILNGTNLQGATLDENTILPDGTHWTPETDMSRYTDPNHPDFWQPDWVKEQKED